MSKAAVMVAVVLVAGALGVSAALVAGRGWGWGGAGGVGGGARGVVVSNVKARVDERGEIIDAHDGCLLRFGGRYYLYGTAYGATDGFTAANRFRCYSSADLGSWKYEGELLASPPAGVYYRPHVVYNARTKLYVLWYNWYETLWEGQLGAATAARPTGPFALQSRDVKTAYGKPGDENLLVDGDGTGYVIYTSIAHEHGIVVERLTEDYLGATGENSGFLGHNCEAPALFKRAGKYYALFDTCCCFGPGGSGAQVWVADQPLGPYRPQGNINRDGEGKVVVAAQQAHVAEIATRGGGGGAGAGEGGVMYVWLGDRWGSRPDGIKGHDFQFWAPLRFGPAGEVEGIRWVEGWRVGGMTNDE